MVVSVVVLMMVTITTSTTAATIASVVITIDPPLSMASRSIPGPSSASQNSRHYIGMLDEFMDTLHEEFLEALHGVFRKAVSSRGADKQHWFTVF